MYKNGNLCKSGLYGVSSYKFQCVLDMLKPTTWSKRTRLLVQKGFCLAELFTYQELLIHPKQVMHLYTTALLPSAVHPLRTAHQSKATHSPRETDFIHSV